MRDPLAFHITMRLDDGRVLFADSRARRRAARTIYEHGEGRGLTGFRTADTHIHAVVASSRELAGRFARIVETALVWIVGGSARFEPARFTPVRDQHHHYNALRYVFRQERRHGTAGDPFHDGGCLPDLVGARILRAPDGSTLGAVARDRVARLLPRIQRRELLVQLGLGDAQLGLDDAELEIDDLRVAAAAAFGLGHLDGRGVARSEARCAAVHVAGEYSASEIAEQLDISRRAVNHLRLRAVDTEAIRAVSLQLRMRAAHRALPHLDAPLSGVE